LAHVDKLSQTMSIRCAVAEVSRQAQSGALPEHLQTLVGVANARSVSSYDLSERVLWIWRCRRARGTLAPAVPQKSTEQPAWSVDIFLQCYRQPQKPSISQAIKAMSEIAPEGLELPSFGQACRYLNSIGAVERERGRRTGGELQALKPFRRRTTEELEPLDVTVVDGHTFKGLVAHPASGRPFRPELCAILDVATRRAIGWSAGLAESADTVATAIEHALGTAGIVAILYADRGSGNLARINAHPAYGRFSRLGITFETGRPHSPQSRGLIERFQQTCWIRNAKMLDTYAGRDMDVSTLNRVTRAIQSEVNAKGTSSLVPSWPTFLAFCARSIDDYNSSPHSGLPMIEDETGHRRRLSPNEFWAAWERAGWEPVRISPEELASAWRPRVVRTAQRGEVSVFNNVYYSKDLTEYNGIEVQVAYDMHDPHSVQVFDLDGRLITVARWNANSSSYFPISAVEVAREKRAKGRLERLERRREEVELERLGPAFTVQPEPEAIAARQFIEAQMAAEAAAPEVEEIPEEPWLRWRLWKRLDAEAREAGAVQEEYMMFYNSFPQTPDWRGFAAAEGWTTEFSACAEG
jgi:putative transposase